MWYTPNAYRSLNYDSGKGTAVGTNLHKQANQDKNRGPNPLVVGSLVALLSALGATNISCNKANRPDDNQTTASQNYTQSKYIANNENLTEDEKALAQRVYELANSGIPREELGLSLDPQGAVNSERWQKWGLGIDKGLTPEQETYASLIGWMEAISHYNTHFAQAIKTKSLTPEQEAYLKGMHKQYGKGPISSTKLAGGDTRQAAIMRTLFGTELGDKELLTRQALSDAIPENLGAIVR